MQKKKKRISLKTNAKRMLIFGIFSVTIIISVLVSIFSVISQIVEKYQEASELEKKIVMLEDREENLNNEIMRLQDKEYLASYAREKYFYSKNGELIIRIPASEKN